MVEYERITIHSENKGDGKGDFVLYWMHASQRTTNNPALEFAIEKANELNLGLVVLFCLVEKFPQSSIRCYRFMLEGLLDVEHGLRHRGIKFIIAKGAPADIVCKMACQAAALILDKGYSNMERQWQDTIATNSPCIAYEIEGNVVVPVETASNKREYSAATLRRKITPMIENFLNLPEAREVRQESLTLNITGENISLSDVIPDEQENSLYPYIGAELYHGGEIEAKRKLQHFITSNLSRYDEDRNSPALDLQSSLSPYLHFGQISPVEIYDAVFGSGIKCDGFLEQLVVRRELAFNYVWYADENYWQYSALPAWARDSLEKESQTPREYVYTYKQLEDAQTHDKYWNAAQIELLTTGKMHGYMRMYWGKKIIEWTNNPKTAFAWAMKLNNVYSLDGRDPNSFAGIAWCFGNHDRPWTNRPIFGNVRYMNDKGLERKFDMKAYIERVSEMSGSLPG